MGSRAGHVRLRAGYMGLQAGYVGLWAGQLGLRADLRGGDLVDVDQPAMLLVARDGAHAVPRDLVAGMGHAHHRHRAPRAAQSRLARVVHLERAPQRRVRGALRRALRGALRGAFRRAPLLVSRSRSVTLSLSFAIAPLGAARRSCAKASTGATHGSWDEPGKARGGCRRHVVRAAARCEARARVEVATCARR